MMQSVTKCYEVSYCDGVVSGGYMVGELERNLMRDTELNREKINSESLQ